MHYETTKKIKMKKKEEKRAKTQIHIVRMKHSFDTKFITYNFFEHNNVSVYYGMCVCVCVWWPLSPLLPPPPFLEITDNAYKIFAVNVSDLIDITSNYDFMRCFLCPITFAICLFARSLFSDHLCLQCRRQRRRRWRQRQHDENYIGQHFLSSAGASPRTKNIKAAKSWNWNKYMRIGLNSIFLFLFLYLSIARCVFLFCQIINFRIWMETHKT